MNWWMKFKWGERTLWEQQVLMINTWEKVDLVKAGLLFLMCTFMPSPVCRRHIMSSSCVCALSVHVCVLDRYDYVEVEDISETSTIIWGRWCGQRGPARITSKTNLIKITFKSDDYFVAKPGFKICYSLLVSVSFFSDLWLVDWMFSHLKHPFYLIWTHRSYRETDRNCFCSENSCERQNKWVRKRVRDTEVCRLKYSYVSLSLSCSMV